MMTPAAAQKEIQRLTKELKQHNYNYYALAQPTISDQDFDHMLEELARLETEFPQFASADSPTQKVGGEIIKSFQTVPHRYPMLSMGKNYSEQDLLDFDKRNKKIIGAHFEYIYDLTFDSLEI